MALSAAVLRGLQERRDSDILWCLLRCIPDKVDNSVDRCHRFPVSTRIVTKRVWLRFVAIFRRRLVCGEQMLSSHLVYSHNSPCDVGLLCEETFYACLAESACVCLGKVFCVLNPTHPQQYLEKLIRQRAPAVTLTDADLEAMLAEAEKFIPPGTHAEDCVEELVSIVPDSELAYLVYTSGSTGEPKAVRGTRGNLHAYVNHFCRSRDGLAADDDSRFFTLSTPFFDPSIGDMITILLSARGVLFAVPKASLCNGELGALLLHAAPTHVVSTPTVWETLPSAVAAEVCNLPHSISVFLGGERLSQTIIDRWAGVVQLYNVYGVTEATVYQSVQRVDPMSAVRDVTCGAGIGTTILVDYSSSGSCKYLEPAMTEGDGDGEVVLRGPQVCDGYADELEAGVCQAFSVCKVTRERTFRTGDLGRLVEGAGGSLQLVLRGRRDGQIKLNGRRVALEEVEQGIRTALGQVLTQCCCCTVQSAHGQTLIAAAVVLADVVSLDALQQHAKGVSGSLQLLLTLYLPAYMVPVEWWVLSAGHALPQTPTGKLDRISVARHVTAELARVPNGSDAEGLLTHGGHSSVEEDTLYALVRETWQSFFGVAVSSHSNFHHLGGDSLGALKLTRAVYIAVNGSDDGIDDFGVLPVMFRPHVLMQYPTLGAYVAVLRQLIGTMHPCEASATAMLGCSDRLFSTQVTSRICTSRSYSSIDSHIDATMPLSGERTQQLLLDVVSVGCVTLASALLDRHVCDVNGGNSRTNRCTTSLHVAANFGDSHIKMMEMLLGYGPQLTSVTRDGVTPAHLAAASSCRMLSLLLERGAPLHCRDARQQSLLHFAARSGKTSCVILLLNTYHMDLTLRDKWQRSAAHWAVLNQHVDVLCAMVEYVGQMGGTSVSSTEPLPQRRDRRRFDRLARKKTHLRYESLTEIAKRVSPSDDAMRVLCEQLEGAVEL